MTDNKKGYIIACVMGLIVILLMIADAVFM